jgi:uncharacterized protein YlxW (UPF0749 family)
MIGDHYNDKWNKPPYNQWKTHYSTDIPITRNEFEQLKKEVEEMKALLIKAKEYDEKNNEPNCEMEDKVKLLKQFADMVGVDLKEIFGK